MGHVIRMENKHLPKLILNSKPEGRQNVGRQKMRWLDDVEADLRALGVKRWRIKALNRTKWSTILRRLKLNCKGCEARKKKKSSTYFTQLISIVGPADESY